MATIDSQEIYEEVVEGLEDECYLYSGYKLIQHDHNATWTNVNTGDILNISNWDENEPLNKTGNTCAVISTARNNGKMFVDKCFFPNRPVCEMESLSTFQLEGICDHVIMDRFFILRTTEKLREGFNKSSKINNNSIIKGVFRVEEKIHILPNFLKIK